MSCNDPLEITENCAFLSQVWESVHRLCKDWMTSLATQNKKEETMWQENVVWEGLSILLPIA